MNTEKEHKGKILKGTVVSDKMKDTAVVSVDSYVEHPKYGKRIRKTKRYSAHDPGNTKKTGEAVFIRETKPISKTKTFEIVSSVPSKPNSEDKE